jgi:hypothetical protein
MPAPVVSPVRPAYRDTNPAGAPPVPGAAKSAVDEIPAPEVHLVQKLPPLPVSNQPWEPELARAATSAGVPVDTMLRMAHHESGFNANAKNPNSSASGIFQFTDDTWRSVAARYPQLGLTNKNDPFQQARAAPYYMREINENLHRVLGRDPTPTESYIGWFLGPEGAAVALSHDHSTPIERAVRSAAIASNPNVFNKVHTVGDLYHWAGQFMGEPDAGPKPVIDLAPYMELGPNSNNPQALSGMRFELKSPLAQMFNDMPPELKGQVKIHSGFRTEESQAKLWQEALAQYGSEAEARKHVAPPGHSNHNHGLAADLSYKSDAAKKWIHDNAAKYGLGFPVAGEDWHIEPISARQAGAIRMGMQPRPDGMASYKVPYTPQMELDQKLAQEKEKFSILQAMKAAYQNDSAISNVLKTNTQNVYDPNFRVTPDMLKGDTIKGLPDHMVNYIARADSQQDFDYRLRQAQKDNYRDQRLAATPWGGAIRAAVALGDPAGIALSTLAPVGFAAKGAQLGRLGRLGVAAADGLTGTTAAQIPDFMSKPGYENEQALWTTLLGTAGYVGLHQLGSWLKGPAEVPMREALDLMNNKRAELESSTSLSGAGAASTPGYRAPIRDDIEGVEHLETPQTALGGLRFDASAKLKNSENKLVAAVGDGLLQDPVGNKDKSIAVTMPAEYIARKAREDAENAWGRIRDAAGAEYQQRHGITALQWKFGGQEAFYREVGDAARIRDPLKRAELDPSVLKAVDGWQRVRKYWYDMAQNPGQIRGEKLPALPGSLDWIDDQFYVPRYPNQSRAVALIAEFGDQLGPKLLAPAMHGLNPDWDREFANKMGEWYYTTFAKARFGYDEKVSQILAGVDKDALQKSLVEHGFSIEEVNKALYQIEQDAKNAGEKNLIARQKRRQLMDENYTVRLTGKNGTRDVSVNELWENNMDAIVSSYSHQMGGVVGMANLRIANPLFKEGMDESERFIVNGIHSDEDRAELIRKIKAYEMQSPRMEDGGRKLDGELKTLNWAMDAILGRPSEVDRSELGQVLRTLRHYNFIRLAAQMGWASISEFGTLLGEVGLRHMFTSMPSLKAILKDVWLGKMDDEELLHWERTFSAGMDYVRTRGRTWTADERATGSTLSARSRRLNTAERWAQKGADIVNNISLGPLTAFQERWALKAALSKFVAAGERGEKLNEGRMRLLGISPEMQQKILAEIRKHKDAYVIGERGTKIKTLGLDQWEPQTRATFEYALDTWVRRMIQKNDLGQMNAFIGSPMGKILFQFRNFTLGSWSKHTLALAHHHDLDMLYGFAASMLAGAMAFAAQRGLNDALLPDHERQKAFEKNFTYGRLAAAGFQRSGASSLIPGAFDFGLQAFGSDPWFDTRATQQPTQGWGANPTTGLIDAAFSQARQISKGVRGDDPYTSQDFRKLWGLTPIYSLPVFHQILDAGSGALPEPTHTH